jgi:hypothetical protein
MKSNVKPNCQGFFVTHKHSLLNLEAKHHHARTRLIFAPRVEEGTWTLSVIVIPGIVHQTCVFEGKQGHNVARFLKAKVFR